MKRMTYITKFMSAFAIVILLALLTACRDEADDVIQPGVLTADKSLTEQFDAIWHGTNQNYVFWEADPTDWDAVYSQYRPRFVELDKQEAVPTLAEKESFVFAPYDRRYEFISKRDNRFDAGLVGGVGVCYRIHPHIELEAEGRCYYALTSTTKDYMKHTKQPQYNTTFTIQAGVKYCF